MTSYQKGPFDTPRPFTPPQDRVNASGASPDHRIAEEGYFGPQGPVPTGPAPPNSYAPAAQYYPTRAQKESYAQQYEAEPTSPMSIPQPQQQPPPNAQQQVYGSSPRRQSVQYNTPPTYPPSSQPFGAPPSGRRPSQPYAPGVYTPPPQDRRQSLPGQMYQPPPVDQLHPTEAYQIPQQSGPHATGRRMSQVSQSRRLSHSSSDRDDMYDRRPPLADGRRYSDARVPPRRPNDQRRASSHDPRPPGFDEDDYYRQRRRGSRTRDNDFDEDNAYKDRGERRHSKASSTGSSGKSKRQIERAKREADARPSYGESLSWAGRNLKKFFSSERS